MSELGWLALLADPHDGAVPVDPVRSSPVAGGGTGFLLLTRGRAKPDRSAVRIEPALLGDGPALAVSLVLPARGARPLFDDPAVVHAMQTVLRDPGRTPLFSTLVDGSTHWAGAFSGIAPDAAWQGWWDDDPFARLGPQHRLRVPPGTLTPAPLPAGPGHQRHAGVPWPWGRMAP